MLTGIIPDHIGNLQQLHALNLSNNYFSGPIPMSFSNLTQIESRLVLQQLDWSNTFSTNSVALSINIQCIIEQPFWNTTQYSKFANFDEDNYRGQIHLQHNPMKQEERQQHWTGNFLLEFWCNLRDNIVGVCNGTLHKCRMAHALVLLHE
ncbi:hypothetical protein CR513_13856, partial [Mucuna pruriens]